MSKNLIAYWDQRKLGEGVNLKLKYHRDIFHLLTNLKGFKQKNSLVLEIGCGAGRWIKHFHNAFKIGLDISSKQLRKVRTGRFERVTGDARFLPFRSESFDLVFSIGVIEHFPGTWKAAKEHIRVCKKGKEIVIGVLNKYSFAHVLTRLKYMRKRKSYQNFIIASGKRYSPTTFKSNLCRLGIKITNILFTGRMLEHIEIIHFILEKLRLDQITCNEFIVVGLKGQERRNSLASKQKYKTE